MAQATPTTEKKQMDSEKARVKSETAQPIGKVIELIGNSSTSFDDAIKSAVKEAANSLHHISGVEVQKMSCKVRDNEVCEYRVDLKLAFGVEHHEHH